jgi:hypothetical protein
MNTKTLFQSIKDAGIPFANHESDLYIPDTPEARAILDRFPLQRDNATRFTNQADPHEGERWIDVPFAYAPWWEAKQGKGVP